LLARVHSTSINRETLPKRSPSSNSGPLPNRIAVLGGGHGLAAVLRALRDDRAELTAIVTVADDGGSSGELRRRTGGPAVGDLRRALVALADGEVALARSFNQLLTVDRLGRHPLGNLLILSLASAFGDLERATEWLCERLGIAAAVLPATTQPVSLVAEAAGELIYGESAIGATRAEVRRLHFSPARPTVPDAVVAAIEHADCVLLAPGSLFTSVLAAGALPDVARALARTSARVVWICNLEPDAVETTGMAASDHLAALRRHGVRVDAALYDPAAKLHFKPEQLARESVAPLPRPLRAERSGVHHPQLLSAALHELLTGATAAPGGEVVRLAA
jgi:uncharacterized cofD-like protein